MIDDIEWEILQCLRYSYYYCVSPKIWKEFLCIVCVLYDITLWKTCEVGI